MIRGHHSTWNHGAGFNLNRNHYPGSQFNVESLPVVTIQSLITARGSLFNVESILSWITIQHDIITWGHNSTWNSDPSSLRVKDISVVLKLNRAITTYFSLAITGYRLDVCHA